MIKKVFFIIVFVIVVCTIAGCSTTNNTSQTPSAATQHVGNVRNAVISIIPTNNNPAVGQSYTIHGVLTDGSTGAPLANQPFRFLVKTPLEEVITVRSTTDANGAYTFTRSESEQGTYTEQVDFYGNADYSVASEMIFLTVGNPTPTSMSLSGTNSNPAINQPFTISGYLTDVNGVRLPDKDIWINIRHPDGGWDMTPHTFTDSNGHFSATYSEQTAGIYRYEFNFMGGTTYAHSGHAIIVSVGTIIPTTTTMSTNIARPTVGHPFILSGYLKDADGAPIAGKQVLLSRIVVGQPMPGGYFDHKYTDQNGYYSFVLTEGVSGDYQYMTNFLGDQTYGSSYFWMPLTVS
jgi:hypothetical protein